jgi:hypothetical protein
MKNIKEQNGKSPAYLKKKEDKIPCAALLHINSMVAFECPCSISKLLGPTLVKIWKFKQKIKFTYTFTTMK